MALHGFSDEQVKEGARVVSIGAGYSAYFRGTEYPLERFKDELASAVEFIKTRSK